MAVEVAEARCSSRKKKPIYTDTAAQYKQGYRLTDILYVFKTMQRKGLDIYFYGYRVNVWNTALHVSYAGMEKG